MAVLITHLYPPLKNDLQNGFHHSQCKFTLWKTKRCYILVCYTLYSKMPNSSFFLNSPLENKAATYLNINQWKRSDKKFLFEVLNTSLLGI